MARKRIEPVIRPVDLPDILGPKLGPPFALVLGTPEDWLPFLHRLKPEQATNYQMDLYPAEQLRTAIDAQGLTAAVVAAPDLWDMPPEFQTVIYAAPQGGERDLKIDMVEQAYHILNPHGTFIVVTATPGDAFFPNLLKKIFGTVHAPAAGRNAVFWCQRDEDKPRRRHEMTFQVRGREEGRSLRFLSRPGVFSYGRLDSGARALVECAVVQAGDCILDLGCGCGTNGIMTADHAGRDCRITFVDSNVRALALTEQNARGNGLTEFTGVATCRVESERLMSNRFDVVLANPPYYAFSAIARLFVQRSSALLRPGGRFYLVTKQPKEVVPMVVEFFGKADAVMRRGYTILAAQRPGREEDTLFRLPTDVIQK